MRRANVHRSLRLFAAGAVWVLGAGAAASQRIEVPVREKPAAGLGHGLDRPPALLISAPAPIPVLPPGPIPVPVRGLAAQPAAAPPQAATVETGPAGDAAGAALFDGARAGKAAADDSTGFEIPSGIILSPDFHGQLNKLETMIPKEFLETPGPLAGLRQEVRSGFQEMRAARERLRVGLIETRPEMAPREAALLVRRQAETDPLSGEARTRTLAAARELLTRYDAILPPAEKLDLSSPDAFAASLEWTSILHRTGGGKAFPFRFGPAARQAAKEARAALQAEIPQLTKPEFEGVARAIGVLVMKDGTIFVAFSGVPEVLRAVIGGSESALEARLNTGGRRRFRVLAADTPIPQGLERVPGPRERPADNRFCAEKKLFAVLRENPSLRREVSQWGMLWRGDPRNNAFGSRLSPAFMVPCPHCVHNAQVMLKGGETAPPD